MSFNVERVRQYLKSFDFRKLFIEELGWDRHQAHLEISLDSLTFPLDAVAEKRGMAVFVCFPAADDKIPDYPTRRKIDRKVSKTAHEHIIIYVNSKKNDQIWQWVKREVGRTAACKEHHYHQNQPGDSLIQKLERLAFSLEEEENLTVVDVAGRTRAAFDVERVTKRFYDRFKAEHAKFLKFLKGIPDEEMQRWYVSVMLNRLMFIYFIQKKGFLDGDVNYLRNKLTESKSRGKDRYYKQFLCPLFFDGFAKKENERSSAMNKLLGKVPYLNGGIFQRHQIEELHGQTIQIPDSAFEKIFFFFEQYQWHLDERPLRNDNEINPDVLGYIFEKYINQKQMGAYYSKEDITEYISKSTVIPYLFDAARKNCRIAFEGEQSIWRLLKADPDRYIYDAVKKGVELALPKEIEAGVKDVSKRTEWNKLAPAEYALPTEIWREVVARKQRYEEIRAKLVSGEVKEINDLITYNLDIRQFARDVIENCEGPELLRAFWHAIQDITVLDPTCGSGAFLFAALNILEDLYEACLDRMEVFLDELEHSAKKHRPEKYSDFRKVWEQVNLHPNRPYFIFKSIIVRNIYGVDIMEEGVEICKLRLFLKLVAQVGREEKIEPLPDIDFNIRAGNTLVGFTSLDAVREAMSVTEGNQRRMLYPDEEAALARIEQQAQDVDRLFALFRQQQTEKGGDVTPSEKQALRKRLNDLENELNRHLATEYGIVLHKVNDYHEWCRSHKPFHWFVEFYKIISNGGFDAIIGNPPYVELSDIRDEYSLMRYETVGTGNLFAICLERFTKLVKRDGRWGVIVPISAISTPRMLPLIEYLTESYYLYVSNFAVRPGKLFNGADMNLSVLLGSQSSSHANKAIYSTRYNRWFTPSRECLFSTLAYVETILCKELGAIAKVGSAIELRILKKLRKMKTLKNIQNGHPSETIYCHSGGRYYRKCLRHKFSKEYKELSIRKGGADSTICLLSSTLYYYFWLATSDCYHVTRNDLASVPFALSMCEDGRFFSLADELLKDLEKNASIRNRNRADGSVQQEINFRVGKSKPIIDEIDRVLAEHYGLTEEELDFIINYDIKYRMGLGVQDEDNLC